MSLSMHAASVPVFVKMSKNMLAWLDKAETHAKAKKFDVNNFTGLRLAPDMLPFARQIQIASDAAKGAVARLAGDEPPVTPASPVSATAAPQSPSRLPSSSIDVRSRALHGPS